MTGVTDHKGHLFRDETVLTDGYTPDEPVGRDTLIERVLDAVDPVVHRNPATNIVLTGPTGSGKTTVVTHVFYRLSRETRVSTAAINCWQYRTRPGLLTELLIQLGYPEPRKGRPVDERLGTLQELLDKSDGAVVALDEFDQFTAPTEIVYDLQETAAQTENELGLILVSNQSLTSLVLDARSRSRLGYQPIPARPYTADDLAAILHDRVKNAFQSGVVSPRVIDRIATLVADDGGDCRQAFSLLLRAGRRAEQEQASEVNVEHVEESLGKRDVQ